MKRILLLCTLLGMPASAQELDCADPQTQVEMTGCAAQDYENADQALNSAYRMAITQARRMDAFGQLTDKTQPKDGADPLASNENMLREAQRAWIPFRDTACAAESNLARGGTMQNQLLYICLARLTRQRTRDLQYFAQGF